MSSVPVALALGSNLGDREGQLRAASVRIADFIQDLRLSTFHETEPVGVGPQPTFINAAAIGQTELSARRLLQELLEVEREFGRQRPARGAARTLDLDLVLYGESVIDDADLTVPHPRFRERRFVLGPLSEIAADWRDPVTRLTVAELLDRLRV